MKAFLLYAILLLPTVSFGQTNPYAVTAKAVVSVKPITKSEFASQFHFVGVADWKPGIKFMVGPVSSPDMKSLFTIGLTPFKKGDVRLKQGDYEWKTFVFVGLEPRRAETAIVFECEGKKYEALTYKKVESMHDEQGSYSVSGLVYLGDVDEAKRQLVGKTLYVRTNRWLKNLDGKDRITSDNPKFVPVVVTDVGLGSQDGPAKILFKPTGADVEAWLNVQLSGINKFLPKPSGPLAIAFDDAFQFTDPKTQYPAITTDTWEVIKANKVKVGMSEAECILAWGEPDSKNTTTSSGSSLVQWVYGSGSYLYFDKGTLRTIQNKA